MTAHPHPALSAASADSILAALDLLLEPGSLAELRVLKTPKGTVSGYFTDFAKLAAEAAQWSGQAPAVYVTLNPVKPELLARAANRAVPYATKTTADSDILKRVWLLIDFDPVRPAGISSTHAGHEAALKRAREVRAWLIEQGVPSNAMILADSGNGAHLLVRINLPNDGDSRALAERCLKALDLRFSDGVVGVDLTTFNAARICKLYGTLACKGDSTPERPHRVARILEAPEDLVVAPRVLLEKVARMLPEMPKGKSVSHSRESGTFDLDAWITEHQLPVVTQGPWSDRGHKWVLNPCPWNAEHDNAAAFIVQFGNGAIGAGCHHNGCVGKDWHALRDQVEPGWRDRRANEDVECARQTIVGLAERAKTDPGAAFEPETLGALALVADKDQAAWMRARNQLKASGVLGKLDKAVEDYKKQQKRQHLRLVKPDETTPLPTAGQMLSDAPLPELLIPEPYVLRPTGTIQTIRANSEVSEREIAFAPVLITGRLRDEEEDAESLRLAYQRPGNGWRQLTVDRGIALDGRKLVDLASAGFPVAGDNAKALAQYLHVLEAINHDRLPCQRVSSHLGWQGDGGEAGFLWGREHLAPDGWNEGPISFHGLDAGDEQIAAAYHAEGTLEAWLDAIKPLARYPRVLLALYVAFVPPLLPILQAPNFIVDWANRTSTGKTTAVRVAASVWGNPDERSAESALGTWDATRVWVERASAVLSGMPLLLDDTSRAKYSKIVADLLYTVASGHGRGRGNKTSLATTRTWRTVMLSTGEAPATSFTQDGGTRMRCLEVRGVPFGKEDAETRQFVDHLNLQILSNYGHAGPAFVRHLLKDRDRWSELQARYRAGVEYYAGKNGRLAQYMAAIHVAADLFHQVFDLPRCDGERCHGDRLMGLWTAIAGETEDAAPEIRALRDMVSWANAHLETFYGRHQVVHFSGEDQPDQPRVPNGGWSGKWDPEDTWEYIGFYPTVLDRTLREMKYEPEAIRAAWKERGWLDTDSDRKRNTKRLRVDTERPHLVVMRRDAIEAVDA